MGSEAKGLLSIGQAVTGVGSTCRGGDELSCTTEGNVALLCVSMEEGSEVMRVL